MKSMIDYVEHMESINNVVADAETCVRLGIPGFSGCCTECGGYARGTPEEMREIMENHDCPEEN